MDPHPWPEGDWPDCIGVDGGGTRTRGVRVAADGSRVAVAQAGASNPTLAGLEPTRASLAAIFEALARSAPPGPVTVCLGLAGVGFSDRGREVEHLARDLLTAAGYAPRHVHVVTDAEIALEAATEGRDGAILIAGTGSVALGRREGHPSVRVGGWGLTLGDEGSGAWLGRELLRRATREHDGRDPDTGLVGWVTRALGLRDAASLVPLVYGPPPLRPADFAEHAQLVFALAEEQHPVATALVAEAARELALHVTALWRRLSLPETAPLALTGGLFSDGSPLWKALRSRLSAELAVTPTPLRLAPAVGAVLAAARAALPPEALPALTQSSALRSVRFH